MSNFFIQYSASATPVEELLATDGTSKPRLVHSSIDKSTGGSRETNCGTSSTNVKYKDFSTSNLPVLMSHASIMNTFAGAEFLMINIREAGSTGTPDCIVEISNGVQWVEVCKLKKVGDVMLLPLTNKNLGEIRLKSSSLTVIAKLDILVGKD
tara:strand:- start:1610 stop:2068 length:459 start_codon:yes stop_codon:yes gene_type:complete